MMHNKVRLWSLRKSPGIYLRAKVVFNQSGDTIEGEELNAFGDSQLAFKYGWNQDKPIVFAVSLVLGLPLLLLLLHEFLNSYTLPAPPRPV